MQEALTKVIEFGFTGLNLNSIEAWTVLQNKNSIKILNRNGFKRNADLESTIDRSVEGPDLIIFSLSRKDYSNGLT